MRSVEALDAILLGLPLQPADKGGGLAYAYRRNPRGPGWEPAEGVPTGWGWNTQRGTSRIAADYLLASLAYDHDPVAGRLNGRPLRWRPARAARPMSVSPVAPALPVVAAAPVVPAQADTASYRLRVARRAYRESFLRVIISRMLRDPTPGAHNPPGNPPAITIEARGLGWKVNLRGFDRFEDHVALWGLGPWSKGVGRLAAIRLRNQLEEQRFLVTPEAIVTASSGHLWSPTVGLYRYILIDPARDFEVTEGFFHLTVSERVRAWSRRRPAHSARSTTAGPATRSGHAPGVMSTRSSPPSTGPTGSSTR